MKPQKRNGEAGLRPGQAASAPPPSVAPMQRAASRLLTTSATSALRSPPAAAAAATASTKTKSISIRSSINASTRSSSTFLSSSSSSTSTSTSTSPSPRPSRFSTPPRKRFFNFFSPPEHASDRKKRNIEPTSGNKTPVTDVYAASRASNSPFYFEAGYALFAKRASRPFPPPFLSRPSSSFSDPLSTHDRSRDRRNSQAQQQQYFEGEVIRGITNGDDAVLVSENLIAANDGVGQWAQKERGHAALWSRLILHFWSLEAEHDAYGRNSGRAEPDPKEYLQRAFEQTKEATSSPAEWYGTTTATGALLHFAPAASADTSKKPAGDAGSAVLQNETDEGYASESREGSEAPEEIVPMLYVTQLGDSQVLVIRPADKSIVFKTEEQWHWFDCPRQLGTNSPDTPDENAVLDKVRVELGDIVLAMSDGVADNLWEHEVVDVVCRAWEDARGKYKKEHDGKELADEQDEEKTAESESMKYVAAELVKAARTIAQDPFAESPFMERAIEEGLPTEGGKLDDISVVAALCCSRKVEY